MLAKLTNVFMNVALVIIVVVTTVVIASLVSLNDYASNRDDVMVEFIENGATGRMYRVTDNDRIYSVVVAHDGTGIWVGRRK